MVKINFKRELEDLKEDFNKNFRPSGLRVLFNSFLYRSYCMQPDLTPS